MEKSLRKIFNRRHTRVVGKSVDGAIITSREVRVVRVSQLYLNENGKQINGRTEDDGRRRRALRNKMITVLKRVHVFVTVARSKRTEIINRYCSVR